MPHSAVVGRSPITANQLNLVSWYTPAGLAKPVASLARSLLSPMPTEHDSRVDDSTAACTDRANSNGSSTDAPRNASSQPRTSTTTSNDLSTAITPADAS